MAGIQLGQPVMKMDRTDFKRVRKYYAQGKEWNRLESPAGRLEFLRTMALLDEYLPDRSRILDLGGGPGRFTVTLAKAGHRVSLADICPELLEMAEQKIREHGVSPQVESIDEVNAVDLSRYHDGTFDAVLALGPFYHLLDGDERKASANEIGRVLRPEGLVFTAFIPRLSGVAGLIGRAAVSPEQVSSESFGTLLSAGTFRNRTLGSFQEGYCPTVDELIALFESSGFVTLSVQSLKGIAQGSEEALFEVQQNDPELFDTMVGSIADTAENRSVIDLGEHALYIGRETMKSKA